ncbi:Ribonuclease 3-like protein 3 [Linum grandiflorum]
MENQNHQAATNNGISPPPHPPLEEVEGIIGYSFNDKKWLEDAMTHPSFYKHDADLEGNGERNDAVSSFERLEYMGDSVINLIFTREHFFQYPELMPGDLTRLRAANVDTEKLARAAVEHGLFRYLRHNKMMLADQVEEFSKEIKEFPVHSNGLVHPPKTLADLVESLIGAVYIDCNCSTDTVWKVFKRLLEPIVEKDTLKVHPVTELLEICQKKKLKLEFKGLWKEGIDVYVNDQIVGRGSYESKKEVAQNRAAKDALDNFGKIVVVLQEEVEVCVDGDEIAR